MASDTMSGILQGASATLESWHCENITSLRAGQSFVFPSCDFPNLQALDLSWSTPWSGFLSMMQPDFLKKMPNLRSLKLHQLGHFPNPASATSLVDLSILKHLSKLDLLVGLWHAGDLKLPPTLKSLAIGTWKPKHATFFDENNTRIEPLEWNLPLLEELRMCVHEVPFESFLLFLKKAQTQDDQPPACFHTLSMTASDASLTLTKETLSHPRLAELKHLSLECCHGVDDSHLSTLASALPRLQSLNVSATEVTGAGIKQIINKGLKKLVANDCRFVGMDAIHWARAQGVQVEHRSTDAMNGGKKLRW